jgi:UDP-N-acetylmuramyl pentapeptide phosphotransferase/UDP-N-acetylglucosamine-1-phosphate transferase
MRARLAVENHRGALVPRTLGLWLAASAVGSSVVVASTRIDGPVDRAGWGALAATLIVFAIGLIDDLAPIGPRGLQNHLRSLVGGHLTTGILKLVVVIGAAVVAVALRDGGTAPHRLAGVVLVAGCANVWNGLDVRPGRALKFAIPVMLAAGVGFHLSRLPTLPLVGLVAACSLVSDLRERAMLGDGGANLLGFTIGLELYLALPAGGVVVGAIVVVALNALAETVTFSRAIDAIPPLRWFDRLGQLSEDGSPPAREHPA